MSTNDKDQKVIDQVDDHQTEESNVDVNATGGTDDQKEDSTQNKEEEQEETSEEVKNKKEESKVESEKDVQEESKEVSNVEKTDQEEEQDEAESKEQAIEEKKEIEEEKEEQVEIKNEGDDQKESETSNKENQKEDNQEKETVEIEEEKVESSSTPKVDESQEDSISKKQELMMKIKQRTTDETSLPAINNQSVSISEDGTRRRQSAAGALIVKRFENINTLYDSFKHAAKMFKNYNCMGYRPYDSNTKKFKPYVFQNYEQCHNDILLVASGLRSLGVEPEEHIGIYSKNRPEWQKVSEACHTQSMISIALYDTLGHDSSIYIINHSEIHTLFCSGEVLVKVLKMLPDCKENLKNIIVFDEKKEEDEKVVKENGMTLYSFHELMELGKKNKVEDVPPKPDSLATIMYTSGTTGMPKGVMITHRNLISTITGVKHAIFEISNEDVLISYLPLAHIFARVAEMLFFQHGCAVGYYSGDVRELQSDLAELKPTLFPVVPRVLDRLYDKVQTTLASSNAFRKYVFKQAFKSKQESIRKGIKTPFSDFVVFNRIKARIGGRVKGILSGGAPLRNEVQDFLRVTFDCPIVQGYGLTETCAGGTIEIPYGIPDKSNVGPPLACCEIKLDPVPDLNYHPTPGEDKKLGGEVCIRGPNVSVGYYKEPEKTAEVFDDDGWFHTGDIGRWNPEGSLSIVDRKKNIFKLAQGEYIAVEHVELVLNQAQYVTNIWVYGNSEKTQLVGVVAVEPVSLKLMAKEKNIPNADNIEELLKNDVVKKVVLGELEKAAINGKLNKLERVYAVHLINKEFDDPSINGLTTSLKIKRNVLKDVFEKEIDQMYEELEAKSKKKK